MFPLKDNIPTLRFAFVTALLVLINVVVFIYEVGLSERELNRFVLQMGMIPFEISRGEDIPPATISPVYLTLFTSMFLHGGWLHLISNMVFLWIFGNNVEDSMGRFRFLIFYLLGGLVAGFSQLAIDPASQIPNIGASGAVAGVLGAYLVLYPKARVTTLIFVIVFVTVVELPAFLVLALWFVTQIFQGVASLGVSTSGGGVAYFAHIGGFLAGLLLIKFFARRQVVQAKRHYR